MRLRVFLVWLLMLAMPLQGFAAASMLFCGTAGGAHHATESPVMGETHAAVHDHGHATPAAAPSGELHAADHAPSPSPDPAHACSLCAGSCHPAAIAVLPAATQFGAPAQADLLEPVLALSSQPATLPDKPPRA